MRKIRIKSPDRQNLVVIETSAVTKGQLIEEITSLELGISTVDINFVDYHSDVTYSLDGAVLPGIDCLLLIVPTKTSQGAFDYTEEELNELGYNSLRSYGSRLNREYDANINLSGKRDDILENILEYYNEVAISQDIPPEDDEVVYIPVSKAVLMQVLNLVPEELAVKLTYAELNAKYDKVLAESK